MGIFARLADLIKSNLNDLISKAEDPEKMLNQILVEMANQLIEAKKGVAEAIAMEKKLAKQAEGEAAKAAEWERRAMMAVRAGDDALAKEAISRKNEHGGHAQTMQEQWQKLGYTVESAADIITQPFDYTIDYLGVGLTIVVILGYFIFMLVMSEKEYRQVIAEKFD